MILTLILKAPSSCIVEETIEDKGRSKRTVGIQVSPTPRKDYERGA